MGPYPWEEDVRAIQRLRHYLKQYEASADAVVEAAIRALTAQPQPSQRGAVALRGIERLEQWLEAHGALEAQQPHLVSEVVEHVLALVEHPVRGVCEDEAAPMQGGYY